MQTRPEILLSWEVEVELSAETDSMGESVAWAGVTFGVTWLVYVFFTVLGITASIALFNPYLFILIGLAAVIQFILDIADQSRNLNIVVLALVFVSVGLVMYAAGLISVSIAGIGLVAFPFGAIIAEKIIAYFK